MSAVSPLGVTAGLDAQTTVEMPFPPRGRARIEPAWSGFGGALGGFVAVIALRAMQARIVDPQRTARSLSMQFMTGARGGDAEVDTTLERNGGTLSIVTARVRQAGRPIALARASFAREHVGLDHVGLALPDVPPPFECEPLLDKPIPGGFHHLLEHRPAGGARPLSGADRAEILVWMRLTEGRPLDLLSATLLADAGPPALYARLSSFRAVPTVEMTLHYAPALDEVTGEWVLGVLRASFAGSGYVSEDAELWSEDGQLLLVGRQLRAVLEPAV